MLAAGAVWKVRPLVPPPCTPPGHPSPEEQGMSDRDRGLEVPGARARDGIATQAFAAPRVFVVSDMRLYRDFLVHELVLSGTVDLIGAAPAADAAAQVVALQPDILLLDVEASGARRLSTGLKASLPALRVVACGVSAQGQDRHAWLSAGVAECLDEACSLEEIAAAVHRVWRDEIVCPLALLRLLHDAPTGPVCDQDAVAIRPGSLTERETQVLNLVAAKLPGREIARHLGLHPGTVRICVQRIMQKLGIPDRR